MSSPRPQSEPKIETYAILVIEDDDSDWKLIDRALTKAQTVAFRASRVSHLNNGLTALRHRRYDAVLLDLVLADGPTNGLDTVVSVVRECADTPVIVLTNLADIETAVRAVEFGAASYMDKPPEAHRLESVLRQVIERYVRDEVARRLTYESVSSLMETEDSAPLSLLIGGHLDAIEASVHHMRSYLQQTSPSYAAELERILGWGNVFQSIAEIRNALRISSPTERDTVPPPAPDVPGTSVQPARTRPRRAISERALRKIQEIGEGSAGILTPDDARAFLLSIQNDEQQ
jgi:ActR/RegA family two-component response regulator